MYSTGKFAILYTEDSPGPRLELTTFETCASCNTCKVFIKGSKQIPKKNWVFFPIFLIILMQERNMSSENKYRAIFASS